MCFLEHIFANTVGKTQPKSTLMLIHAGIYCFVNHHASRLPTAVVDAYRPSIAAIKEKIAKFNAAFDVGSMTKAPESTTTAATTTSDSSARVMCRPSFDPTETPLNLARVALPSDVMTSADFAAKKELLDYYIIYDFSKVQKFSVTLKPGKLGAMMPKIDDSKVDRQVALPIEQQQCCNAGDQRPRVVAGKP